MALIVQKFGGTSVGDLTRISAVAARVKSYADKGHQVVVVLSAMSGQTNYLTSLCDQISPLFNKSQKDVVVSSGEQITIGLLAGKLIQMGQAATSYLAWQIPIKTNDLFGKSLIKSIETKKIKKDLAEGKVVVVAGFQGVNHQGRITTLGRGGSDITATALAAVLKASYCQIFTDVDGVYTTDPRIVPNARRINELDYEEMLELASLGSKVLDKRSVEFACKYNVPLQVLSSLVENNKGTWIKQIAEGMEKTQVSAIALNRNEAKITILGVPDTPGIAAKILGSIAAENIDVDMIIQNISAKGLTDFTFTVPRNDYEASLAMTKDLANRINAESIQGNNDIVKVSLVGTGMRSHTGVASKMFKILEKKNINIMMISTSEIKISIVINEVYADLSVQALHKGFKLAQKPILED